MKNGKKPTVSQRKFIEQYGLEANDWLVVKDTPESMIVKRRDGEETKTISKEK